MAAEQAPGTGGGGPDPLHLADPPSDRDLEVVAAQLGRPVRAVRAVGHRCDCGNPDVLVTDPALPDGTPFPTLFYLTCPRAAGAVSTLESAGMMRNLTEDLAADPDLAAAYRAAHDSYLAARARLGENPLIAGISAGGMPDRVKCLHVLVAHSLAAGGGVNPLGDLVLAELARAGIAPERCWGGAGACAAPASEDPGVVQVARGRRK